MGNIMAACLVMEVFVVVVLINSTFTQAKHEASIVEKEFNRFVKKYNKPYKAGDNLYNIRLKIFESNLERQSKLNTDRLDNVSAVYGVTKFSDLTPQEFKERYLSSIKFNPGDTIIKLAQHHYKQMMLPMEQSIKNLPVKVDWRKKGVITSVKNQRSCGGCWAFSVVETVEAMNALKTSVLKELSIQEVIDCSYGFSILSGCAGGDTCVALSWMNQYGIVVIGLNMESEMLRKFPKSNASALPLNTMSKTPLVAAQLYPLQDQQETCQILANETRGVRVTNFTCQVLVKKEFYLMKLLASYGPVAVSVDATNWSNYQGGIIQYHCGEMGNNHAVQIVGYDRTGPVPYYIVKNSWGRDFGLDGYVYVRAGANTCGIAQEVAAVAVTS